LGKLGLGLGLGFLWVMGFLLGFLDLGEHWRRKEGRSRRGRRWWKPWKSAEAGRSREIRCWNEEYKYHSLIYCGFEFGFGFGFRPRKPIHLPNRFCFD